MELITELADLVKEGFYTSIVCMFLFWLLPFQNISPKWLLELSMRFVIALCAFVVIWLTIGDVEINKSVIKQVLITMAFASLFYEFVGKYAVRKWFDNYKLKVEVNKEQ